MNHRRTLPHPRSLSTRSVRQTGIISICTHAEIAFGKLEYWRHWAENLVAEDADSCFLSEQLIMGCFPLLESCELSTERIFQLLEETGEDVARFMQVTAEIVTQAAAEAEKQQDGEINHEYLPWPQEEFCRWLAPKPYCTSRPKKKVLKTLEVHRQRIVNLDEPRSGEGERIRQVLAVCLYTLVASSKPPIETELWIDRNDFRPIFRRIREKFTTRRGKRALKRLIDLTSSAVQSCTWKERVSIGDLPEMRPARRSRTKAEKKTISEGTNGRPKSAAHRQALSASARKGLQWGEACKIKQRIGVLIPSVLSGD